MFEIETNTTRIFFEKNQVAYLINEFRICTSKYWPRATVFWQIDDRERIHTGKIMFYDP
ncbi:DUF6371 domain-containing protein [Marinilabilia sp.]|uniref:DUF6371 domain-containing protein n=1 Tax=Marinilabilia sp. TaxID=2021252 RepID=UPI00345D09FB